MLSHLKLKHGDKDQNKKWMSFHIDGEKLLEKFLVISSDSLLVYKNKYYLQVLLQQLFL